MKRNDDVDALVHERLTWLKREITDREESIANLEKTLAAAREKQTEAMAERARLLAFLPEDEQ